MVQVDADYTCYSNNVFSIYITGLQEAVSTHTLSVFIVMYVNTAHMSETRTLRHITRMRVDVFPATPSASVSTSLFDVDDAPGHDSCQLRARLDQQSRGSRRRSNA